MSLRRVIVTGLLTALALVFNIVEGTMPLPLPGIKLGAANVFSLVALVLLGVREAFAVTLLRVCLAWLVTGNWFAFLCSMAGGLLATCTMAILHTKFGKDFSLPWISAAGACAFNAGQIAVVAYIVGDRRILVYAVPLFIAGAMAGWAVGVLASMLCDRVGKIITK
jgi:heptaprenyl diphosphate synthase